MEENRNGESLLERWPRQRDALFFLAIAQRYLHRIPGALRTIATLEQYYPHFSRLHEERGRCYVELRQARRAIEAFLKAVNINHALPGSWSTLEGLYRMRRRGLYSEGLDQWKHFEPWLGPLKDALGDALTRYREQ